MKPNFTTCMFLISLALAIIVLPSCNKGDSPLETINTESIPPSINTTPGDLTINLLPENNRCSKVVTLEYNVSEQCPRSDELTVSLDAPGLVSQSEIDADGNVSFDVEFCSLDPDVIITMTTTDGCGNVTTDMIEVSIIGQACVSYECQKFQFGMGQDGTVDIYSNDYDAVDNLCNHADINITYSNNDYSDTVKTYTCQHIIDNGINPNLTDSLYFWVNEELVDSCRILIFFLTDANGDGDLSDSWQNICDI